MRDLANTQLQTIELCSAILRMRTGDIDPPVFARLQRAVDRCREVGGQAAIAGFDVANSAAWDEEGMAEEGEEDLWDLLAGDIHDVLGTS